MPTTSPSDLPQPPYPDAPYIINENWCIGDTIDIINANTEYFENKKVNRSGDTMTGELIVQDDVTIENGGNLNLNCGYLKNFSVEVKNVDITAVTPDAKYVLQPGDCGKIIVVNSAILCKVTVPAGLKVGFNVMIVSNTSKVVNIVPDPVTGASVQVKNIYGFPSIAGQYGICNFVIIAPNVALISGDLN